MWRSHGVLGVPMLWCSLAALLLQPVFGWLAGQSYTLTPEMYIVGDSTEAGWNIAKALKMTKDAGTNVFRRTLRISNTGYGFKWVRSSSGWSDDCGAMRLTWEKNLKLGYGAKGRVEQIVEVNVPPASATAVYDVVLDMDQGVWSYFCSSECDALDKIFPMIAPLVPLTVLYSGKLRGALLPTDDTTGQVCTQAAALQPGCSGGLPYIAGYTRRLRAQGGSVVLADAGEFFFGGDFYTRDQGAAAATLANLSGYDVLNANMADFRGGAEVYKNFSAGLGSVPVVLSNGLLPGSLQGRRPSGQAYISGYAAVRAAGATVGFLGLTERKAEDNVPGLQINRVRGDVVASIVPNMDALRTEAKPNVVVVMNSHNVDSEDQDTLNRWDIGTLTGLLPGFGAVLGGVPSVAPLSVSGFGTGIVAYGWMNSYGGKYLQKVELLVNARGNVVDYNYSSVKMDQSAAQLTSNDPVLLKAYDLYSRTVTGGAASTQVGVADVPFFFEGDPSVMQFSQESTPMMSLAALAFYTLCTDCDLVMVHPSFVNAGLKQGPVTTADIERAFPLQGADADLVVIEVSGAELLEGLKELYGRVSVMAALKGGRIAVNSAQEMPYPLSAVEVANRNGPGYSRVDRSRTYRVGLPRFHLARRIPQRFSTLAPVRNLGSTRALFQTFVQQTGQLTLAHAGGLGAPADMKAFRSGYFCEAGKDTSTDSMWASRCWLAQGARPEDPDRLGRCPEGSQLDPTTLLCRQCPAGTRALYQANAGDFYSLYLTESFVAGQQPQRCAACEPGQISTVGQVRCQPCPRGTYSDVNGGTVCRPCVAHSVALDPGASQCVADLGYYLSANTFVACPAGRTTGRYGAPSAEWCLCREGSYDAGDGRCLPCPGGMSCPFGSTAKAWLDARNQVPTTSPYPTLLPKFWSSAEDPYRTYNCQTAGRCPGGNPGTCGPGLEQRSCAHCQSGSWWTGDECKECTNSETSRFLFPVVPLIVATAVLAIQYKLSGDDVERWSAYGTIITTLLFVTMSHYQTLNLLWAANLKMPATFSSTIKRWTFVNNGIDMFKPACQGMGSFQATVIAQSVTPLIIAAICLGLWGGSKVVAKFANRSEVAMHADRTFNVFASVMYTFFSGVAAMSLLLFKCRDNPSGDSTLSVDLSVICFTSDEWKSMLGVGIAALIVYCGGMGSAFLWAIVVATKRFRDRSFRACWKCLFIKYRADTWWWSAVFLAKYFFYNILFVASTDPIDQLYWMMTITQIYGMMIIVFMPYRVLTANGLEALAGVSITYACSILTDFSPVSNPDALSTAGSLISYSPLLLFGLLVLWKTYWHVDFRDGRPTLAPIKDSLSPKWVKELGDVVGGLHGLSEQAFLDFARRLGEYDAFVAKRFMVAVKADLFGESQSSRLTSSAVDSRKEIVEEARVSKMQATSSRSLMVENAAVAVASV